ncbi:MAG TPA: GNAT family N-acetyltransferase, partial [Stellaceae bacterium]|nr:GNAT family N-acetyltransferase [Stellaceae bacterium]
MESGRIASLRGSNDNQPSRRSGWVFRKLWPRDAEAYAAHLRRLDPPQRAFRFGRAIADEWVGGYVAGTDWFRSAILGCWVAGELRGVGEIKMLDRAWPRAAEAALSVERAFEARGIGTVLFMRGLLIARNRGISRVTMLCSAENLRVQRIIRKVQPNLAFNGDQIECEIGLEPPNALSIAAELYDDGCALALS